METVDNKRIIFFIPRMGNGGAERVIATLANELVQLDYSVLILSLTSEESFYELNDRVEIIGAGYRINKENKIKRSSEMFFNGIKSIKFLQKIINSWKPDIVVSFLTHTNIISTIVKLFNPGLKLVVSERAEPYLRGGITRIITKYSYTIADYIICQSNMVSSFFPKYAQKKIKIIENPINKDAISNISFKERTKKVVAVGRLFEQKNFSLLINSFSDITDEFPEHTLEIYGEGPLRENLQKQINDLKLNEKVFLKGVKKDVMKYIADSELFVMSSNFEGFPNALVEAMASGLPVISTDFSTGVARDLIKDTNGIVVPINDRNALTEAMKSILSNKKLIKKMSINNKKIREDLSIDKILVKWIDVFNALNKSDKS